MLSSTLLLFFIGTSILLIIIPGPDLIFTVVQGITNGKKAGVTTAIGLSLGNIVHSLAAAFGLSVIFTSSEVLFTGFKAIGTLYLFYLAFQAIKHRKETLSLDPEHARKPGNLFLRGFIMNVVNPKVALFFLTFLPQFVQYETGSVALQMCLLGLIFMVLTAIIFGLLGYFSGTLHRLFFYRPGLQEVMNVTAALIFVGLGLKLITTTM
ncbi:LysE family translocator [Paenibacillus abyssi]|uniref:LysE family translocator n=2 Tax=Paenibacillus abyssi TaxID=1340531 RepID=A0A917LI92_9BACL|nr:LysE family translocator [Paenibacillus abyssi]GGG25785.1 LysE family translocator [Paenibacillus abyssi]